MTMSISTKFITLVALLLAAMATGFHTTSSRHLSKPSSSLFPSRQQQQQQQSPFSRHSMAPFWRSSSSADNESDEEEETEEPKLPSEEASTVGSTVPVDDVNAMAAAAVRLAGNPESEKAKASSHARNQGDVTVKTGPSMYGPKVPVVALP